MTATELIDKQIADLGDWRGEMYKKLRKIISETDKTLKEEWKWGTAVWSKNGLVCAVGAFKDHVKINFFQGAILEDKDKLFNGGLESKKTRSIDFFEKDEINVPGLKKLIRQAAGL